MKKKFLPVSLLSLFLLTSCSKGYIKVDYYDILDKIDNGESFIFFAGKDDCGDCQLLIKNIKKAKINNIYYIDIKELEDLHYDDIVNKITSILPESYFIDNHYTYYQVSIYSPTILKYVEGNLIYGHVGSLSVSELKQINNFNFNLISHYSNYLNMVENNFNFKIYFIKDESNKLEELSKEYSSNSSIAYYMNYSTLDSLEKIDIINRYNQLNSTSIGSIDEVEYLFLNYEQEN